MYVYLETETEIIINIRRLVNVHKLRSPDQCVLYSRRRLTITESRSRIRSMDVTFPHDYIIMLIRNNKQTAEWRLTISYVSERGPRKRSPHGEPHFTAGRSWYAVIRHVASVRRKSFSHILLYLRFDTTQNRQKEILVHAEPATVHSRPLMQRFSNSGSWTNFQWVAKDIWVLRATNTVTYIFHRNKTFVI